MNININNKRIIFTIDFDAFFASCEVKKDPSLQNKPVVIGKGIEGELNLGVITTASYQARKYGFKAATPIYKVLEHNKTHHDKIVIIPPDFDYYLQTSRQAFEIIQTYSPKIQVSSIDECYLDVTEIITKQRISPLKLAKIIQEDVKRQIGIDCSIGIANNILISKIASDLEKPLGISTIFSNQIQEKLWPLTINKLYGVGYNTLPKMKDLNINTIGDLAKINPNSELGLKMEEMLGKKFHELHLLANGISSDEVFVGFYDAKSISHGRTFSHALNIEEVETILKEYSLLISKKLVNRNFVSKTVFLKYKTSDQKGYGKKSSRSKQIQLDHETNKASKIYNGAIKIYDSLSRKDIVHLTLGVSQIEKNYLKKYKQKQFRGFSQNLKQEEKTIKRSKIKEIIEDVNLNFNIELMVDLHEFNTNKKYNQESINQDNIKFKVWDDE